MSTLHSTFCRYPLELHLVHIEPSSGKIAVMGWLFKLGEASSFLNQVQYMNFTWSALIYIYIYIYICKILWTSCIDVMLSLTWCSCGPCYICSSGATSPSPGKSTLLRLSGSRCPARGPMAVTWGPSPLHPAQKMSSGPSCRRTLRYQKSRWRNWRRLCRYVNNITS